jgi:hypothetical protein
MQNAIGMNGGRPRSNECTPMAWKLYMTGNLNDELF